MIGRNLLCKFATLVFVSALATGIAVGADIKEGLMGYWPLDGDAKDAIGVSDGQKMGGAEWAIGRVEKAVKLDGVNGHVVIDGFALGPTNTVTFVAWINGWKQSDWAGIVVSRGTSATWMGFGPSDTLTYVWNANSPNTYNWAGAPKIPQNEWALVAIAIDPDAATSFIYSDGNGLKSGVNESPHIEETIDNVKFGWDECCGADRHFNGLIDEVMIYDRTLNEDEITQLATQGLAIEPDDSLATTWGMMKSSYGKP